MKQVFGQSTNEFLSQKMQVICDQLALSEPSFENTEDVDIFFQIP